MRLFQYAESDKFESLLPPLLEMLQRSPAFNLTLGRSALFVVELTQRLRYPKALVQKKLLQMLRLIYNGKRERGATEGGSGAVPLVRLPRQESGRRRRQRQRRRARRFPWAASGGGEAEAMREERRRLVTRLGLFPLVRGLSRAEGGMGFVLVMEVASMLLRDMTRDFVEG